MRRFTAIALITVITMGAAALARGEEVRNDLAKDADAGKFLASWSAPGSPENRGTTKPPGHHDLAMENYEVNESFKKVWEFYAAKCGCPGEYKAGRNIELGGGDKNSRYLLSLVHNSLAGHQSAQCTIAVNSDAYTVLIHLSAADIGEKKTYINVIAGLR